MGFKGKSISVASYDAGNRLTAWNRAGADKNHSQTWDYDDAGNWNSSTKDGDTESRDHSVSDQITQLDGKAVNHDLKGNLTEYEYDRTDYRVKYDLDNRIVEVKADSETIRYRYDALGRRIISKGDEETVLIWWGDSECAEYEHRASKDAIQNDIMGHPTRLNSVIARDTEDRENRVELQWYHKNYLDHVYAVSDDNGNLIEHYRYTAFGEPEIYSATGARRNTSAIGNTVMWNTRRYDADNGLYYYKYRHYAANIGRWLGRDPIEEDGGYNLYAFVGNEPVGHWDKFGEDIEGVLKFLEIEKDCYTFSTEGEMWMEEHGQNAVTRAIRDAARKSIPNKFLKGSMRAFEAGMFELAGKFTSVDELLFSYQFTVEIDFECECTCCDETVGDWEITFEIRDSDFPNLAAQPGYGNGFNAFNPIPSAGEINRVLANKYWTEVSKAKKQCEAACPDED